MDSLGIFKFLTVAYDFYKKNKEKNSINKEGTSEQEKKPETPQEAISRLLNLNIPKNEQKEEQLSITKKTKPLQENMILTMQNHNEFVKRVLEKNNKKL